MIAYDWHFNSFNEVEFSNTTRKAVQSISEGGEMTKDWSQYDKLPAPAYCLLVIVNDAFPYSHPQFDESCYIDIDEETINYLASLERLQ